MIDAIAGQKTELEIATVAEKILLEKQLPFNPDIKQGPTIDLYFHELTTDKSFSQKLLVFFGSFFVGLCFIATLPAFALLIKISSRGPVFQKVTVPGKRGITFKQYRYSTKNVDTQKTFALGTFFHETKLEKLPSIINVLKGEMELIGPSPYPANWCNHWNKELSDFYKRFAHKPGFFNITEPVSDHENTENIAESLKKEFNYILNPTFKKDMQNMLGRG